MGSAFGTSVTEFDVFYATFFATNHGSGTVVGTANVLLEGLDVDLAAPAFQEDIHALTLVGAAINTAADGHQPGFV